MKKISVIKYFYITIFVFNTLVFSQIKFGIHYLSNSGDLPDRNFSSRSKNGFGFFIEKSTKLKLLGFEVFYKADFDYTSGKYSISYQNLNMKDSGIKDEIYHISFTPVMRYKLSIVSFYAEAGLGIERYNRKVQHSSELCGIDLIGDRLYNDPYMKYGVGISINYLKNFAPYLGYSYAKIMKEEYSKTPNWMQKEIRNEAKFFYGGILLKF